MRQYEREREKERERERERERETGKYFVNINRFKTKN